MTKPQKTRILKHRGVSPLSQLLLTCAKRFRTMGQSAAHAASWVKPKSTATERLATRIENLLDDLDHPRNQIGFEYEYEGKVGVVVACEYNVGTIRNLKTGEQWPAFRFRLANAREAFWTKTFPDRRNPLKKRS